MRRAAVFSIHRRGFSAGDVSAGGGSMVALVEKVTSASLALLTTTNVVLKQSGTDICFITLFFPKKMKKWDHLCWNPPQTGAHVYLSAAYLSPKRKRRGKKQAASCLPHRFPQAVWTCLLGRWGRWGGRRKVLATLRHVDAEISNTPYIFCLESTSASCVVVLDPLGGRLKAIPTPQHTHTHIPLSSGLIEIEMSFPPVSLPGKCCCGAAAFQPPPQRVISSLPSHFSHLVNCLTRLRGNLSSVNCPPTKHLQRKNTFLPSLSNSKRRRQEALCFCPSVLRGSVNKSLFAVSVNQSGGDRHSAAITHFPLSDVAPVALITGLRKH